MPPAPIQLFWKVWYQYLSSRVDKEVIFLNYGFYPPEGNTVDLRPEDEPNRPAIQLYHHVASAADLKDKHVLEVSCGHGGGAALGTTASCQRRTGVRRARSDAGIPRQLPKRARGDSIYAIRAPRADAVGFAVRCSRRLTSSPLRRAPANPRISQSALEFSCQPRGIHQR